MIQANELRIGNWIAEKIHPGLCQPVFLYSVRVSENNFCTLLKRLNTFPYQGIRLTPEILEKCGFYRIEEEKLFAHDATGIDLVYDKSWHFKYLRKNPKSIVRDIQLAYLHQLQNLYFALTGEELKINLNVETAQ